MYYSNLCLSFVSGAMITFCILFMMQVNNSDPIREIISGVKTFSTNVDETMTLTQNNQ